LQNAEYDFAIETVVHFLSAQNQYDFEVIFCRDGSFKGRVTRDFYLWFCQSNPIWCYGGQTYEV